ncbi:arf-GAP with dual PH domain-containing protein 1-like isoform X2 [Liolophura sinensis]|uniref:arf-GAP with dual PH domain-containing protein 1-like isoform X2 n=1 Tax=Liolophura sinensis TaxID=3198878 RepID=UPI0031588054
MAERSKNFLLDLQQKSGNDVCVDCGAKDPEWASYNIGVFLCQDCAGIHRSMGTHISKIKSIKLDNWENSQLELMAAMGNEKAKSNYEQFVPAFYRRPKSTDPLVLREQWIHAKYERAEFQDPERQAAYTTNYREGTLYKRGRDDKKYYPRKFALSTQNNTLSYFNKEVARTPKASINLDTLNAVFVPEKTGNPCALQLMFDENGSTRNVFVYANDPKEIVDWFHCIRAAKLSRKQIAFPDRDANEMAEDLTHDFLMEGWLSKMGPNNEPYRRRWFTLDRRKLMYTEDPLNAFALGELFIGHKDSGGYSVEAGVPDGKDAPGFGFTLTTPNRVFYLSAESKEDMDKWIDSLQKVMEMPLTPQDSRLAATLVSKRRSVVSLFNR